MRFAYEEPVVQVVVDELVPSIDPDTLEVTPELRAPGYGEEFLRDNYLLQPESGIAMLPLIQRGIFIGNQVRDDIFNRGVADGTLEGAYRMGVPGVPKPITPDVVRPAVHPMDFYTP